MKTVNVASVSIYAERKPNLLNEVRSRLAQNKKTIIFTTYSEFLYAALKNRRFLETLNKAHINLADGISVIWVYNFLNTTRKFKKNYFEIFHLLFQVIVTGASLLLTPKKVRVKIPETISGADLFWDLLDLAEESQESVFFFGGTGEVPARVAEIAKQKKPNLHISGYSNRLMQDPRVLDEIRKCAPGFLLVAVQPQKQETWIAENMEKFPSVKLVIGLGGTFDYIAGIKKRAPKIINHLGLEWLFKLLTQPYRAKRIFKGFFGLIFETIKLKLKTS